ncbi:MAG: hypothetical protein ACOCTI_04370 [Phycisphaeraceae bacterium]
MSEHHPDIFDDTRAARYLMLPGPRSMDTIRSRYRIEPLDLPGPRKWHRVDLDAVLQQAREGTSPARRGRGRETRLKIQA